MKVLEAGKFGLNTWTGKYRCTGDYGGGCQALLEVDKEDLRWYPGVPGDSWGSRDPAVCFKCPICSKVSDVPRKDWPGGASSLRKWTSEWYNNNEIVIEDKDHGK